MTVCLLARVFVILFSFIAFHFIYLTFDKGTLLTATSTIGWIGKYALV